MKKSKIFLVALTGIMFVLAGCDLGTTETKHTGPNPDGGNNMPVDFGDDHPDEIKPKEDKPVDLDKPVDEKPVAMDKLHEIDLTVPQAIGLWDDSQVVTEDQLSDTERERVDILRQTIFRGLGVGSTRYLEAVSQTLSNQGLVPDYENLVGKEGFQDNFEDVPDDCPFVRYYDNGFVPTGSACEYLVDKAIAEVYSEIIQLLDKEDVNPMLGNSGVVTHDEARFWLEQGAISGIEENRVMVRADMKKRGICSKKPTPMQSSMETGVLVGRQVFAEHFNNWLKANGHVADYPKMSKPIQVCNADQTMLEPAKKAALKAIDSVGQTRPLCPGYEPKAGEDTLKFAQAQADYAKGAKSGIIDEFSLAAVKVFKVIPCNVGDPIVIDLDGDGIELLPLHKGVNFDLWGTGRPQAMAWVGPRDGFLVRDVNNNGIIDSGEEMFGNIDLKHSDGFAHLASLDSNGDGVLDARDEAFASLRIWRDANSNGKTDEGELLTLESVGLTSIPLVPQDQEMVVEGNSIPKVVDIKLGETKSIIGDAFLRTAPYPRLSASR